MGATPTQFDEGPARSIPTDDARALRAEMGLCLSGGGYRAMLFHLGTLWRMNEFGLLPKIARLSSVSGGSITSGALALAWNGLVFDEFGCGHGFPTLVAEPLIGLANRTIDLPAIGLGLALPGVSVADVLVREYNQFLFHGATLQDLPDPNGAPEFVFNATNLQSLALWRFSKGAMQDWRVGKVVNPTIDLAVAVAASSAFPPVLSPLVLRFEEGEVQDATGTDLHVPPYTTEVVLSDGGVYDNMGIETVWKRFTDILVSDAGGKMSPEPDPKGDWARQGLHVLMMGDNQVRNLRKRQVVDSFQATRCTSSHRNGAFWSIRGDTRDYPYKGSPFAIDHSRTTDLADEPTRLRAMEPERIERLINWGYAMCDVALQSWYSDSLPVRPEPVLPFPGRGI